MTNLKPVPGREHQFRFSDRPEGEAVEIEVYYTLGRSPHARGIYLSIRPVTIGEGFRTFDLLSGYAVLVRRLARSSPRVLREVAAAADDRVAEVAAAFRGDRETGRAALDALAASLGDGAAVR